MVDPFRTPDGADDPADATGGAGPTDVDISRLTDAETPTQFSHELYIDSTNLRAALADCSPTRSLEVGCGYGRLTPWIADRADEHHAFDQSQPRLAVARAEHPDVRFCRAKAEALPFPDDAFDLAVTWGVLNHVPSTVVDVAAAELNRVVSPDGTVVVSEATDGTPDPRWEYRSVREWCDLFTPRELVWQTNTERNEEPFRDPDREHVVMKFR